MEDRLRAMVAAGLMRHAGRGNDAPDGPAQAARLVEGREWGDHLLDLKNEMHGLMQNASPTYRWNAISDLVMPRVNAEAVPPIEDYARRHGLSERFVRVAAFPVMLVGMADALRDQVRVAGVDDLAEALLDGRLPCGVRAGRLLRY